MARSFNYCRFFARCKTADSGWNLSSAGKKPQPPDEHKLSGTPVERRKRPVFREFRGFPASASGGF